MKRLCKECGKEFEINDGEIQFYRAKKLELPKRCKECRERNKKNGRQPRQMDIDAAGSKNSGAAENIDIRPQKEEPQKKEPQKGGKQNRILAAIIIFIVAVSGIFGNQYLGNGHDSDDAPVQNAADQDAVVYHFRNDQYLSEHFEKHGGDFSFATKEEYEEGANQVISSKEALHKLEAEDGDDVYYLESTNEFVIVSTDGYIRTYFKPEDGIEYYNRQ